MAAVVSEQIKNNMLFFRSTWCKSAKRPGPSRPPRQELSKRLSKGKQPTVSEQRKKMDWKLVVRTQDNMHPSGHGIETDVMEYLEVKKTAPLQHPALGSTPYLRDPPLRLSSKTEGRSMGSSVIQPRQEKTVLQPMVYRRPSLANTLSNPILKEYCREHIPIEGLSRALKVNWPTPFSAKIMEVPFFPKVKLPTIEPFDGTTDPNDHLSAYKHQLYVQAVDDATWCKNFPATLKSVAQKWLNNLPPNLVNNFTELSYLFTNHFIANLQEHKTSCT